MFVTGILKAQYPMLQRCITKTLENREAAPSSFVQDPIPRLASGLIAFSRASCSSTGRPGGLPSAATSTDILKALEFVARISKALGFDTGTFEVFKFGTSFFVNLKVTASTLKALEFTAGILKPFVFSAGFFKTLKVTAGTLKAVVSVAGIPKALAPAPASSSPSMSPQVSLTSLRPSSIAAGFFKVLKYCIGISKLHQLATTS